MRATISIEAVVPQASCIIGEHRGDFVLQRTADMTNILPDIEHPDGPFHCAE